MKAHLSIQKLQQALAVVTRALGREEAGASLLLQMKASSLQVSAHNGDFGMAVSLDSEGEDGSIRVPGKLFSDLIKSLDEGDITLNDKEGLLQIQAGSLEVELRGVMVEGVLVEEPGADSVVVEAEAWALVSQQVDRAASRDESRPMLTGVSVTAADDALTMVATDSYRLAVARAQLTGGDWTGLVPARTLNEIARIVLQQKPASLSIERHESLVRARVGDVTVNSRLIEGSFPQYEQLIPKAFTHELKLSTATLLQTINRMSVLSGRAKPLRFSFSKGWLEIAVDSGDLGRGGERIECEWTGPDFQIGFNGQYLREGLELVGEEVHLKMVDEIKPSLLTIPDEENFLYLIMPVRLNA
jgi:DNA polymerase-3 subunit beta